MAAREPCWKTSDAAIGSKSELSVWCPIVNSSTVPTFVAAPGASPLDPTYEHSPNLTIAVVVPAAGGTATPRVEKCEYEAYVEIADETIR